MPALLLPLLILIALRFFFLDARPIHHDESVNGWFVDGIFQEGFYKYDPQNYHGPLYFYLLVLSEKIFGRSLTSLRIPPAILGSLLTLTPFLFRNLLGRTGAWIAAFLLAVSPAMVFYSRYSIHETGFALLCILFTHQWLRIRGSGFDLKRILLLGFILGALASMKETFVLFGAALLFAEAGASLLERQISLPLTRKFWTSVLASGVLSLVVVVVLYSGFFQHWSGVGDFFRAFFLWGETGSKGNGHQKPIYYWFQIMASLEWPALAGLLILPFFLTRAKSAWNFVSLLGLGLFALYSLVAYKTPWCILSFYLYPVFAFSWFSGKMLETRAKYWVLAAWIAILGYSAYRTYDVAYKNPDQDDHFYVYGQTYHDFLEPVNGILARVNQDPKLSQTLRIQVVSSFTWPLPYLLGEIKQVAYYSGESAPPTLDADILIIDDSILPKMESRIQGGYYRSLYRSRQWAGPVVFMVRGPAPKE
jgi:uncharacterized protein (TIGR03663 family)